MPKKSLNPNLIISYHRMRQSIGWLGLTLPFLLLIGNYIINNFNFLNNDTFVMTQCYTYNADSSFKSSISHYYYTTVGEIFTGILCAVALFMFSYRGYPQRDEEIIPSDSFMTNLAGICALGIVLFPTSTTNCISDNIRNYTSSEIIGCIHYVFAAFFFITLSLISIFNFRRTAKVADFGKMPSHNFYKYCGITMLACLVLILIYSVWIEKNYPELQTYNLIYALETIALLAFGLSWLKKGRIDSN
jgi:heme A synthase